LLHYYVLNKAVYKHRFYTSVFVNENYAMLYL